MARPTKPISALKRNISAAERARREKAEARLSLGKPPRCPQGLDADARKAFRQLIKELEPTKLLTAADGPALAVLADAIARHRECAALIAAQGPVIQGPRGPMQNPAVLAAAKYSLTIRQYGGLFGLSPESRAKLAASVPAEPEPDPESSKERAKRMFPEVFGRQKKEG